MSKGAGEFFKNAAIAGVGGGAVQFMSSFAIVNGVNAVKPLTVGNVWGATAVASTVTLGTGFLLREKAPNVGMGCAIAGLMGVGGSIILGLYAMGSPQRDKPITEPVTPSSGAIMPPQVPNPVALVARALMPR